MRRAALVLAAGALLCAGAAAGQERPLVVYLSEDSDWRPFIQDPRSARPGAMREIMRLVFRKAAIPIEERVTARGRAVRAFAAGEGDFALGAMTWDGDRVDSAVYSATLFRTVDRLLFRFGDAFPFLNCAQVAGREIWGVTHYVYPCADQLDLKRMDGERGLVGRIAAGDIPAAFVEQTVARYWARKLGVGLNIGPPVATAEVRVKLQPHRAGLLQRLNVAILEARRWGEIDAIIDDYVTSASAD